MIKGEQSELTSTLSTLQEILRQYANTIYQLAEKKEKLKSQPPSPVERENVRKYSKKISEIVLRHTSAQVT